MKHDLIYDIGMNNGDDTAYYLSKGYRVVAVEANPLLVKQGEERFKKEIQAGKLILLNIGIAEAKGIATFWVNEQHDEWSSFIKEVAGRQGLPCYPVEVPCVPLRDLFIEYGVPYYLKVDIEGNDIYCLRDLMKEDLPVYVSVEAHRLEYLCILSVLGFNQFKCVDQSDHNSSILVNNEVVVAAPVTAPRLSLGRRLVRRVGRQWPFSRLVHKPAKKPAPLPAQIQRVRGKETQFQFLVGSSGPFGEDSFGDWEDLETVAYNWLHYRLGKRQRGTLNMDGWFDFHAKRSV